MSNGAGVTEDESRASKHVLFNAEKAQALGKDSTNLASLMYWDRAEVEASQALRDIPAPSIDSSRASDPTTLAGALHQLDLRLLEYWYPRESFPRWTQLARDHALMSEHDVPAATSIIDEITPFVDSVLQPNPASSTGSVKLGRQKAIHSIRRASALSNEEPGLALYLFHTSEQLEEPISLKRQLYQHARLAAESYSMLLLHHGQSLSAKVDAASE